MSREKLREGFTIIEVVLVLAIAGLIFLMVFIALPTLQRQSRDTQRREDMAQLISAIKKYQQNNRGALPASWGDFRTNYLKEKFIDPSGVDYTLNAIKCDNSGSLTVDAECDASTNIRSTAYNGSGIIWIFREAGCDGEKAVKSSNPRRVAVMFRLESGGTFCETN